MSDVGQYGFNGAAHVLIVIDFRGKSIKINNDTDINL
jgi:hypothetical protein